MKLFNSHELTQLVEKTEGANLRDKVAKAGEHIITALKEGKVKTNEFSIRELTEHFIVDNNGNKMGQYLMSQPEHLREAAGIVSDLSTFSRINGQIMYSRISDIMNLAEFNVSKEFEVIPSTVSIDRPEQFANISVFGDESLEVQDGQEFPTIGPNQMFQHSPKQKMQGAMCAVTWAESVADRTGEILMRMDAIGEALALKREKTAIDVLIGAASQGPTGFDSRYKYKDTYYNTYQTSATSFGAINSVSSNALVNHLNINEAYVRLSTMTNPETGEPINNVGSYTLVVSPQLALTAQRISVATQLRTGTISSSDAVLITDGSGSAPVPFKIIVSKYLPFRLTADSSRANTEWYFGDLKKAFAYVRAADLSVQSALPMSGKMFSHNLVMQNRAWFCESPFVWQPRAVTKNLVS